MIKCMLTLICGLPGVGKTLFAKELARRIGAEYLSSDSIRIKALEKRTYSEEEKGMVYGLMAEEAEMLLQQGKSVILDATFYLEKFRNLMRRAAEENNVQLNIIECVLDEAELKRRIEKRGKEKTESEADFEVYLSVKKEYEAIKAEHLVIDTALRLDQNLEKAIGWMKGR